jgi:lactate dehydrogenase-like 2-hydroxyacid dehydrogenase
VISKHGVGYENIDLAAARERGVKVAIAGGSIADSVADMALALLLALARQIPRGDRAVRAGAWPRMVGMELRDKMLGIVGLGQIGKAVCRRAKSFGMRVIAYDTYPDQRFAESWGVRYLPLEQLLAEADVVSLHAPVTAATHHMIDAPALARMKAVALPVGADRPGDTLVRLRKAALARLSLGTRIGRAYTRKHADADQQDNECPRPTPLAPRMRLVGIMHVHSYECLTLCRSFNALQGVK